MILNQDPCMYLIKFVLIKIASETATCIMYTGSIDLWKLHTVYEGKINSLATVAKANQFF